MPWTALMAEYEQYCPIAKATEVVGERWTLLVIRELLVGSRHFNDLARGLPGMSRTMLSKRLTRLEALGLVEKHDGSYLRTDACEGLRPIVLALGEWSNTWLLKDPTIEECDLVLLMWWAHRRLNVATLPRAHRTVVHFRFVDAPEQFWVVVEDEERSICLADPGFEIDATVSTDVVTLHKIWHGREPVGAAVKDARLRFSGSKAITRHLPTMLALDPATGLLGDSTSQRPNLYA